MTAADTTRLAGEAYRTRFAREDAAGPDNETRLVQEGYQSKLAREAGSTEPEVSEFYKVGEKIGDRYEVAAIHHGAMGVVYGCFDHHTKLPRALKTVRACHAGDKQVLALFESEAAVWISLEKHPYIVRAFLVDRFNNLPHVITEYVTGPEGIEGDLRGWLGHPRLTLRVAVTMALQIAQGMQHAVRKVPNLVHRDLKPANILVNGDGKAMVTDFGLVHAAQSDAGTPAYMSPEQWRAEGLDARSDIYAYGCILFEMFTAHRLFPAVTEHEWENAHLQDPPAALTSLVPELPREIDRFVQNCLAKDRTERPRNWDDAVTFFAEWYHRLTGNAVVMDFSSLALDAAEWISASYSLSRLKRFEDMINACERSLAIDSSNAAAWYNNGTGLSNIGRHEAAIKAFDRAVAIDPTLVAALSNMGYSFCKLKRYQEAMHAYDCALAVNPKYFNARFGKGVVLAELKRYVDAITEYDKGLGGVNPNDDATLWFHKGHALLKLERFEEALSAYNLASSIDGQGSVSFITGFTLLKLKRYEESILACDRALSINPSLEIAQHTKGVALQDLKRRDVARFVPPPPSFWTRFWGK